MAKFTVLKALCDNELFNNLYFYDSDSYTIKQEQTAQKNAKTKYCAKFMYILICLK